MGEPIHKLATRGVLLWAELDRDFFQVEPKERRVTLIEQRKHYLIERINADGRRAEALLWRRRQGRAVRPRE
jgi:fatty acid synthase subunit beta